ncbi:hypothetical protein Tco_1354177, partial [Tanacetum coccineum]
MGRSYYPIPCSIISTRKDRKTPQWYPDVPTTSWRISIRSMDSFQGLTTKSPSSWHRPLAPSPNFYDYVNPVTRRTIDQSVGGKLRDLNAKEYWALLEDIPLYDNESWNDPRNFAKPVMAIALPQDVPSTSNRRLIDSKINGPHNTQYCMEDQEQAFVEYTSSRTDEAGDARLSMFEADFKRQQGEMTNKIDTVLKAITDQIAGTLTSDIVKNLKLSTSLILSARSYPTQCHTPKNQTAAE